MKHKKYLAVLVCLLFGVTDAFACPGCMQDSVPVIVPDSVGDNHKRYTAWLADARFWFSEPNKVSVYNASIGNSDLRKSGTYRIVYEYGVPFIHFEWNAHTSPRTLGERYLILRNERFILLYNSNTEPVFRAFADHSWGDIYPLSSVRASSTLTHGGIHFAASPDRFGTHINRVWAVEGGVGERLYIVLDSVRWEGSIFLSIGYVHYSRPYLFQANSRPKRLRILDPRNEARFFEVELEDTPHFQTILFGQSWGWTTTFIIEILEIYPGVRYNHMCINSIMGLYDFSP